METRLCAHTHTHTQTHTCFSIVNLSRTTPTNIQCEEMCHQHKVPPTDCSIAAIQGARHTV
ncbi:unnamed protein product [Schistosoma mansoni]|uniref:Smp_205120 n=1 Tax=Schistosoma mansoni TaxID=6183 RepID=UPI00022C849D|nr:unnamed protein product [Schistosoma mansoni]|eukprot:XP_018647292.1 unnamed protein product [Schistosoma mansoni]